jgi:Peptidase S24-like
VSFQPEELLIHGFSNESALPSSEQVRLDLAAEVLRRFGEVRFIARGSSMIPSIFPGDLLIVRSQRIADSCCGQIVLCLREGRFWAHRLIRKWRQGSGFVFATRGDALPQEDPAVGESQMLGRVTSIVRYGQPMDLARMETISAKVLRWGVRHSSAIAKTILRQHSLRLRLLGYTHEAFTKPGPPILECM